MPKKVTKKSELDHQVISKPVVRDLDALNLKPFVAAAIGCQPDQLLKFRIEADETIVAIGPDGRKYKFVVEPGTWDLVPKV